MRFIIVLSVLAVVPLFGQSVGKKITPEEFQALRGLIRPQSGEFAWYDDIPWQTRIGEARELAARDGKPLAIWTSADGQPCGAG